jgi:DNA-binding transcriptional MerR regulator
MNIGELSRLTGLPVKTIRYYSDVGLVPVADRTMSNYRRYDHGSLVRLEYVRTLRELGLDIATIRRVLDQGADLRSVAIAHVEAIGAQIRVLRLRRAALRAIADRDPSPKELDRMYRIAQATADERRRIIDQFFDSVFQGVPETPDSIEFATRMRSVSADLPDDPTDEQVDAWLELAELVRDEGFQAKLRAMGKRTFGDASPKVMPTGPEIMRNATVLAERVGAAIEAGIAPSDPAAGPIVDELVGPWAAAVGRADDDVYRRELADGIEEGTEPRAERYWQLLAIINGWPPIEPTAHRWTWLAKAIRARLQVD